MVVESKDEKVQFTIIITTRNRCETLYHTIKTCLAIRYDNYKILISDNNSSDDTKKIVQGFASKKIEYINTGESLSMTENWEFAISHVNNGFVTILGDDDGFLPNSLKLASKIINNTDTKALTWQKIEYCWPDHIYKPFQSHLSLPFLTDTSEMSSKESLYKIVNLEIGYTQLPCIYNSFISIDLINKARMLCDTNYIFDGTSPDVYSAILFTLMTDSYIFIMNPLSINGASKNSNGTAQRFRHIKTKEAELFNKENKKSKRIMNTFKYPQGLVATEILNALVNIQKNYPFLMQEKINKKKFLKVIASEYSMRKKDSLLFYESVNELLEVAEEENIKNSIEQIINDVVGKDANPQVKYGISRTSISFNSKYLGVQNIYDAVIISHYILLITSIIPNVKLIKKLVKKLGANYLKYIVRYIKNKKLYKKEYKIFKSTPGKRFLVEDKDKYPCLNDKNNTTSFDKHYTYHTAWAARKVKDINPAEHVDISSLTYFSTLVSAFIPIKFYDYRPTLIELDNFSCHHADITDLPFASNSVKSLSSMHVVEHIGLGRYGDPLDVDGDLKAIKELKRVLANDGYLLFVVPIGGTAKIMFNAHRIYSYQQVIDYFNDFELLEFTLIPDQSSEGLIVDATEKQSDNQNYGCGCFMFKKTRNT